LLRFFPSIPLNSDISSKNKQILLPILYRLINSWMIILKCVIGRWSRLSVDNIMIILGITMMNNDDDYRNWSKDDSKSSENLDYHLRNLRILYTVLCKNIKIIDTFYFWGVKLNFFLIYVSFPIHCQFKSIWRKPHKIKYHVNCRLNSDIHRWRRLKSHSQKRICTRLKFYLHWRRPRS